MFEQRKEAQRTYQAELDKVTEDDIRRVQNLMQHRVGPTDYLGEADEWARLGAPLETAANLLIDGTPRRLGREILARAHTNAARRKSQTASPILNESTQANLETAKRLRGKK